MFRQMEKARWPLILFVVLFSFTCSTLVLAGSRSVSSQAPASALGGSHFDKNQGPGNGGGEGGDPDELGINAAAPPQGPSGTVVSEGVAPQGVKATPTALEGKAPSFWENPWVLWWIRVLALRI
jgi:hypothetical protein